MDADAVREFVSRDWSAVAVSKMTYWAERFRDEGWRPAWEASDRLLADVRRTRADYPTDRDRASDVSAHLALRDRLDRVADGLCRR